MPFISGAAPSTEEIVSAVLGQLPPPAEAPELTAENMPDLSSVYVSQDQVGVAGGVAELDAGGQVPEDRIKRRVEIEWLALGNYMGSVGVWGPAAQDTANAVEVVDAIGPRTRWDVVQDTLTKAVYSARVLHMALNPTYECKFALHGAIDNIEMFVGMKGGSSAAPNELMNWAGTNSVTNYTLWADTNSSGVGTFKWACTPSGGGTQNIINTGVAIAAGVYHVTLDRQSDTSFVLTLRNALTGAVLHTTPVPAASLPSTSFAPGTNRYAPVVAYRVKSSLVPTHGFALYSMRTGLDVAA